MRQWGGKARWGGERRQNKNYGGMWVPGMAATLRSVLQEGQRGDEGGQMSGAGGTQKCSAGEVGSTCR